ncbi:Protein CBG22695 [Caenorhabditis briggsae]|uniref:Protein CBG22695 n=1 Tax=Caenorhabditis briggsae TaxID=6238 RepID=A8Y2Z0_CAEBR|nr:Protein CBG22695 [Caenorhabditis briggsae]CAP39231.2 Protein CBG22695 [Caenorhabditis briggsae]
MDIPQLSTLGLQEIVLSRATEKSKVINVEQKMLEKIMTPKRNESENETDMFLFNNEMLFKADVRNFELSEDNIRKINTLEVHSLKINCETNKYQDEHHYNIIRLLEDCLNSKSREQLAHLNIEGSVPFQATWFRDILELFPNLKSFVRENAFHLFFPPLPFAHFQLVCLDLSNNRMRSLKGVSQLPNLEVLVMRHTQLENASDYDDLFLLSKLKYLDVSRATKLDEDACHTLGHLVERNMSMVSLKHIDCANLRLNYRVLATLLSLNPAINSIVLYGKQKHQILCSTNQLAGTLIHDALDPNVKVLAAFDLKSSVSLLDHYYSLSRETMVQDVLMEIREFSNISILLKMFRQHLDKISSTNKYEMITFLVKSNLKPKESFCYIVSQTELLEIPELDKELLFRKSLERIVYMWGSESYDLQEFTAIVVMMECSIDSALTDMSDAIREKLSVRASLMSLKLGVILYRFCLLLDVATEVEEIVIRYLTILRTIYETIGWQIPLVQLLFESLPKALNHTATAWGILKMLYLALPHIHRNVIQQNATFDLALVLLKLVFQDYSYFEDNDVFYENDVSYFAMYLLSRMFHPRILKRWKRDLVLITINFVEAFEYERFFIMWLKPNGIKWREVSSCRKPVVRTFKMLKFKQMRIKNMDDVFWKYERKWQHHSAYGIAELAIDIFSFIIFLSLVYCFTFSFFFFLSIFKCHIRILFSPSI